MKVFVSRINTKFSIREVAGLAKKQYPLVHRAIKPLIEDRLLSRDERGLLSLNCRENLPALSYVESLRKESFLEKNKAVGLFARDVLDGLREDFFILLVFGSSAAGKQAPRDVDVLLIVEGNEGDAEKIVERIASNFSLPFHCTAISAESARQMLSKRNEANVMNETLSSHIVLFGAENYYRMLEYAG